MTAPWPVWAATPALLARDLDYTQLAWASLGLLVVLLGGALVIAWVDRWRKRQPPKGPSAREQLAHFRSLYDQGELSKEEFERIRGLLMERAKRELDAAGAADKPLTPGTAQPGSAAPPTTDTSSSADENRPAPPLADPGAAEPPPPAPPAG
jgi:hypothetical protein